LTLDRSHRFNPERSLDYTRKRGYIPVMPERDAVIEANRAF